MVAVSEKWSPSKNKRLVLGLVTVLFAALTFWSVLRLVDQSNQNKELARKGAIAFEIDQLRRQQSELSGKIDSGALASLYDQFVLEPDGMIEVLDNLRAVGRNSGLSFRYSVSDRRVSKYDPTLSGRTLKLSFNDVEYEQLLQFLKIVREQKQWYGYVHEVSVRAKGAQGTLEGFISFEIGTRDATSAPDGSSESVTAL